MKSRQFIFSIAIMILIYTFTLSAANAQNNDNFIVGGKRVGPIMLGEQVTKYEGILGPRKTISSTFYQYPNTGLALLVKDGIIEGIMVTSDKYKTKEGLQIGSTTDQMVKLYGNYLKTDSGSLIYTDIGLAVNTENSKISNIMVIEAEVDPLLGDKTIVPGVRAGNLKIGMDIGVVKKYWGEPDSKEPLKQGVDIKVYKYGSKAVKLLVGDGIIHGVLINSYKFQTPEGIGINGTRQQVVNTYGAQFKEVQDSIKYNGLGIGFFFSGDKIVEIMLDYRR